MGLPPAFGEVPRPPLALSGHLHLHRECLLSGVKRTSRLAVTMSAYDPKRTLTGAGMFKEGERAVHPSNQRVVRSIAGLRALAKIHNATRFRKGTKNAIVHHLLSPTRPKIFAIGTPLSTRNRIRMIQCQRLNDSITLCTASALSAQFLSDFSFRKFRMLGTFRICPSYRKRPAKPEHREK
jgi:hypothetical protein